MRKNILFSSLVLFGLNLEAAEFNPAMQAYINELKTEAKAQNSAFPPYQSYPWR